MEANASVLDMDANIDVVVAESAEVVAADTKMCNEHMAEVRSGRQPGVGVILRFR